MSVERRVVLKGAAISALVFTVEGARLTLSPRQAHAADIPMQVLKPEEKATLEGLGDVILPGAKEAGIANFIDHQLAGDPDDCLLIARSLSVSPPYHNFYAAGLAAVDAACRTAYQKPFADLTQEQKVAFVRAMSQKNPDDWQGPPSPFFYFVVRNDATDVVYGTVEGFEKLGVPYMPHILPEKRW
jgi:Gluconate 2-dehydrogenase subunit 3